MAPHRSQAKHGVKVAVIGAGPAGLTALKSLREEGFDAVAFERRASVGGLWSYDADPSHTSVLRQTVSNISRFVSGFSDFPLSKDYPTYLDGAQVAEYFHAYATHFDLIRRCRFNATVKQVSRNEKGNGWNVHVLDEDSTSLLVFDRVVFATGSDTIPQWPRMIDRERFKGTVLHAQSYRKPEQFTSKRVLVVGLGNTACDIALNLAEKGSKVFQSYRRGKLVLSRYEDSGLPTDCTISWPLLQLKYLMDYKFPRLASFLVDKLMIGKMINSADRHEPTEQGLSQKEKRRRAEENLKTAWRLIPCPGMAYENPTVQESFFPALHARSIEVVHGFKAFHGEDTVVLEDDSILQVDAVVFCTGYSFDWSIMPELEMNGAYGLPLETSAHLSSRGWKSGDTSEEFESKSSKNLNLPLPRLYQMIFPPHFASSIAFLSWMKPQDNVWNVCELASMAVAQIWASDAASDAAHAANNTSKVTPEQPRTPSMLPSIEEMDREIDSYHHWWRSNRSREPAMHPGFIRSYLFYRFVHEKAGTGMYDLLDHMFTDRGWKLWYSDPELYKWLSSGPTNTYAWRLVDTNPKNLPGQGRQSWSGARQAVKDAYEEFHRFKQGLQ